MLRIQEKYIAAARQKQCVALLDAAHRFLEYAMEDKYSEYMSLHRLYKRWAKESLTEAPTVALIRDAYFMQTGDNAPQFLDWS